MLFLGAIVGCAYFGGVRPGAIATLVAAICLTVQYFSLPADSPRKSLFDFVPSLLMFVLVGLLVSYLSWECRLALREVHKRHRAEEELMQRHAAMKREFHERQVRLETELAERQRAEEAIRRERDDLRAEWEAADEKLLKELEGLRREHGDCQEELARIQQQELDLRRELDDAHAAHGEVANGLQQEIKDLQAAGQRAREEWMKQEQGLRKNISALEAAKRRSEEELAQQKKKNSALEKDLTDLQHKHERELAEWETAFREADAACADLRRQLLAIDAEAKAGQRQLGELTSACRAAEDRADQIVDRLHGLLALNQTREAEQFIEACWVANRLSRGNLPLRREPVELAAVIARAMQNVEKYLESRGQHLITRMPLVTEWLWGDPIRLEQCLVGVLDAVLRRAPASVDIELIAERQGDDIVLHVADRHSPVSAEEIVRLSELRVPEATHWRALSQSDSDLGFAIARSLVELHHGELTLSAAPTGSGYEAILRLPVLVRENLETAATAAGDALSDERAFL
jgi:K+-sensing histidine kinase KdpD